VSDSGGPNDGVHAAERTRAARARHRSAVAVALAGHGITLHEVIGRGAVHRAPGPAGRGDRAVKVAPGADAAASCTAGRVLRRLRPPHLAPGPPVRHAAVAEIRDPEVAALVTTVQHRTSTALRKASAGPATAADHHLHLELIRQVRGRARPAPDRRHAR
jgi:hypothetical protein